MKQRNEERKRKKKEKRKENKVNEKKNYIEGEEIARKNLIVQSWS